MRVRLIAAPVALLLAAGCGFQSNGLAPRTAASWTVPPVTRAAQVRVLCPPSGDARRMRCFSMLRADLRSLAPSCGGIAPYCPADLRDAYGLTTASLSSGNGQTVAIVDAFGYKDLARDVGAYRSAMHLKRCPAGSCFRIVNQFGKSSPLPKQSSPSDDWFGEQALDAEMVSAICPNCKIVVVQTNDDYFNNLDQGVVTAVGVLHASIVSMSFGGREFAASDSDFGVRGVTYVASSGDSGAGVQQPCAFVTVVCVGGTELSRATNSRGWTETVWNTLDEESCGGSCGATGSGCSAMVKAPRWQGKEACGKYRVETDISAEASVNTPVAVFSTPEGGWTSIGGTSAAAPMIAAIVALAGNAAKTNGPQYVWAHRSQLFDVTKGNDVDARAGVLCPVGYPKYVCTARRGYDGPTGWGTPNGIAAL